MLDGVFVNAYTSPAFDKKEILRYAACKEADEHIERLLEECLKECENVFSYRVCYRVFEKETFSSVFFSSFDSFRVVYKMSGFMFR